MTKEKYNRKQQKRFLLKENEQAFIILFSLVLLKFLSVYATQIAYAFYFTFFTVFHFVLYELDLSNAGFVRFCHQLA